MWSDAANGREFGWEWGGGWASVAVLFGCDGHELFGSLGDVVGALDDLLSHQLHIGTRSALGRHRLPALALQPLGAGGQQTQGDSHHLRARLLRETGQGKFIHIAQIIHIGNSKVRYKWTDKKKNK